MGTTISTRTIFKKLSQIYDNDNSFRDWKKIYLNLSEDNTKPLTVDDFYDAISSDIELSEEDEDMVLDLLDAAADEDGIFDNFKDFKKIEEENYESIEEYLDDVEDDEVDKKDDENTEYREKVELNEGYYKVAEKNSDGSYTVKLKREDGTTVLERQGSEDELKTDFGIIISDDKDDEDTENTDDNATEDTINNTVVEEDENKTTEKDAQESNPAKTTQTPEEKAKALASGLAAGSIGALRQLENDPDSEEIMAELDSKTETTEPITDGTIETKTSDGKQFSIEVKNGEIVGLVYDNKTLKKSKEIINALFELLQDNNYDGSLDNINIEKYIQENESGKNETEDLKTLAKIKSENGSTLKNSKAYSGNCPIYDYIDMTTTVSKGNGVFEETQADNNEKLMGILEAYKSDGSGTLDKKAAQYCLYQIFGTDTDAIIDAFRAHNLLQKGKQEEYLSELFELLS